MQCNALLQFLYSAILALLLSHFLFINFILFIYPCSSNLPTSVYHIRDSYYRQYDDDDEGEY